MKVMTVVGTRPEVIRLSRIIPAMDEAFNHVLVHTGQNYDPTLNENIFKDLGLRWPDLYLNAYPKNPNTVGRVMCEVGTALQFHKPDAMLVIGDTDSVLGATLAAKRLRVPIFHMEAGNRCWDDRVPEEVNRRLVDHTADINLPYSSIARENLLREGLPSDRIIKTGSPMREVLEYNSDYTTNVLSRLGLQSQEYFLVSVHRAENVDNPDRLHQFLTVLAQLRFTYGLQVIVTTHPRTRRRLKESDLIGVDDIRFCEPFPFTEYLCLQRYAKAVLSDSGTITEEASILDLRALNLRDAHERPEGMEEGSVMMVGLSWERIGEGLAILERQKRCLEIPADYRSTNVSQKVVRIILSYTDYVRRVVWSDPPEARFPLPPASVSAPAGSGAGEP